MVSFCLWKIRNTEGTSEGKDCRLTWNVEIKSVIRAAWENGVSCPRHLNIVGASRWKLEDLSAGCRTNRSFSISRLKDGHFSIEADWVTISICNQDKGVTVCAATRNSNLEVILTPVTITGDLNTR